MDKPNGHLTGLLRALVVLTLLQGVLGAYLATGQKPLGIHPLRGTWLMNAHYWISAVLILGGIAAIASLIGGGFYRSRPGLWFGALGLFATAFLGQITGNLLPWHRHDVQTAAIEGAIAGRMPVVGPTVQSLILGGETVSRNTFSIWNQAHWILGILALGAAFLVWKNLRSAWASRFDFALPILVPLVLAGFVAAPRGELASAVDATSYDATVSWYTWPLHGALKAFGAISPSLEFVGTGVLPGLFGAFLVSLPWLGKRLSKSAVNSVSAVFFFVFVGLGLAFGGNFAPVTGNQDPPAAMVAEPVATKPVDEALVAKGQALFRSSGCMNCHAIDGSGRGIDLTSVHKKQSDPAWYKAFIKNPAAVKKGSTMPAFGGLSDADLAALADFLRKERP